MWLVDSSVFIQWMRRGVSPTRELMPFVLEGLIASCGVVRVEVLRGIIKPDHRQEMGELFGVLSQIQTTAVTWECVAQLAWEMDRKGMVIPVPDLIIATCALQAKATLVTLDAHFARIPGLKVCARLPARP